MEPPTGALERPCDKKVKVELFDLPSSAQTSRSVEEVEKAYKEAIKAHPFFDNAHCLADVYQDGVFRDNNGTVVGIIVKQGLPEYACTAAADVLRPAATRTTLRSSMYGGESPLSGIAGYFDYRGSPIEHKYRKTAFTYDHVDVWPKVFPMIDYVSQIYKKAMPENWARQDAAIPDVVRIHGSPFSTLTINSRFRTAHHTDAGDFDDGYGCLACLEGPFKGLALTLDDFRVTFVMQPRDVLIFNPHHFHSNTEPETLMEDDWKRLTCVFYYRASLGEPPAYAEYKRRLGNALAKKCAVAAVPRPLPLITDIVVKDNGKNYNRPAPVHKVQLTPFALTATVYKLSHCSSVGGLIHELLAAEGERMEVDLFGEPLCQSHGISERPDEQLQIALMSASAFKLPPAGGFKECGLTLQAAAEKQQVLDPAYLTDHVSPALLEMWVKAREQWLALVRVDWVRTLARDKSRTNFTWNNRSDMNMAFFDLCEVAKQVLLGLLNKDTATPKEEQSFWAIFASNLNAACVTTLQMPEEAMSVRKLNVKIKDFTFGGTRYLKDMPADEQKRRLDRKARIEEARRSNDAGGGTERKGGDWLANDSFDYQTENQPVEYGGVERPTPVANADAVVRTPQEIITRAQRARAGDTVRVLVVLPPAPIAAAAEHSGLTAEQRAGEEAVRLLDNPSAKAMLETPHPNAVLPAARSYSDGDGGTVEVTYAYLADCLYGPGSYDFIVLQHVLATIPHADAAAALVRHVAGLATGAVLVEETDLQDRQYFRLKPETRAAYWAVAEGCFRELHHRRYGTESATLRTKADLEGLLQPCCVRYKLVGSALNTTVLIVPGTGGDASAH